MAHIRVVYASGRDMGEAEGVFLEGKLIGSWSRNDAIWRQESYQQFMAVLGISVETSRATPAELEAIRESLGL